MKITYPIYVCEEKDIPNEPHFAVIMNDLHISYDNGYGDRHETQYSTQKFLMYLVFQNVEQVQQWIKDKQMRANYEHVDQYRVIYVTPCVVNTTINVNIVK